MKFTCTCRYIFICLRWEIFKLNIFRKANPTSDLVRETEVYNRNGFSVANRKKNLWYYMCIESCAPLFRVQILRLLDACSITNRILLKDQNLTRGKVLHRHRGGKSFRCVFRFRFQHNHEIMFAPSSSVTNLLPMECTLANCRSCRCWRCFTYVTYVILLLLLLLLTVA